MNKDASKYSKLAGAKTAGLIRKVSYTRAFEAILINVIDRKFKRAPEQSEPVRLFL